MMGAGQSLRVMSYNIRHGVGNHPADPRTLGDLDLDRVVQVIQDAGPAIVGLQEVDRGQPRSDGVDQPSWLANKLGMHSCYGPNVELDGGEYGTAILSRYPIRSHENILLPTYDGREPRGLLVATIDVPGIGPVTFANTHLQVGGPGYEDAAIAERRDQAARIAGRLGEVDAPVVLTGDFNAQPGDPELAPLDLFRDAWQAAGNAGPGYTIPTSPTDDATQRIDMIYVGRQWRVLACRVVITEASRMASDHYPVIADLEIGDQ